MPSLNFMQNGNPLPKPQPKPITKKQEISPK